MTSYVTSDWWSVEARGTSGRLLLGSRAGRTFKGSGRPSIVRRRLAWGLEVGCKLAGALIVPTASSSSSSSLSDSSALSSNSGSVSQSLSAVARRGGVAGPAGLPTHCRGVPLFHELCVVSYFACCRPTALVTDRTTRRSRFDAPNCSLKSWYCEGGTSRGMQLRPRSRYTQNRCFPSMNRSDFPSRSSNAVATITGISAQRNSRNPMYLTIVGEHSGKRPR